MKTTTVAKLDSAGVYWGLEEIPIESLTADHIEMPNGCDQPPGRYRWDAEQKALMPLDRKHVKMLATDITSDRVLYELCRIAHERDPKSLPAAVLDWCAKYETSWDADNGRLLNYFRALADAAAII